MTTPHRPSRSQRRPATPEQLDAFLHEMDIHPGGVLDFELMSRWAAKDVWRIDRNSEPWAFIRYLLGNAQQFPDRWRHLQMSQMLYEEEIGPAVYGLSPESTALGGKAVLIEAALLPLDREELEARAGEAIALMYRLHTYTRLREALARHLTEADINAYYSLSAYYGETRERWYKAVAQRWQTEGLREIEPVLAITETVFQRVEAMHHRTGKIGLIVPAHNDPNHGNFMLDHNGELRLIDFEELGLNNPVADLGIFLTWYVDKDQHFNLLNNFYPLHGTHAILGRMKVWTPLRYLNISAHWAARLTQTDSAKGWAFAARSVQEWLKGACELVFDGTVPEDLLNGLELTTRSLLAHWSEEEQ